MNLLACEKATLMIIFYHSLVLNHKNAMVATNIESRAGHGQLHQGPWHRASHLWGPQNLKEKSTYIFRQNPSLNVIFP